MKILVVMKNWLGDLLFQMPALDLIKKKYPEASITCVAPERCREILEAHPAVSGFVPFDEKDTHRPLLSRFGFAFRLRKLGPWDQAYIFHRSKTRAFLLMLAGAKERIGYGKGRKWLLTRPLPEPPKLMHQLDYFLEMMRLAGFEVPKDLSYRFYYKKEDRELAQRLLKAEGLDRKGSFICFHLGANWEPKRWPAEHFAALAERLWALRKFPVVVTGSRQDQPLLEAFLKKVRDARVISFVGKTGLGVSAAIYENSACLVTGDSGPMHIASGVGAPVIALFGPTDPKLTGPRGAGESLVLQYVPEGYSVPFFGKDLPPEGWLCKITPEQVSDAVERILSHSLSKESKVNGTGPGNLLRKENGCQDLRKA
jgi:heptosyltransferase I